MKILSWNTYLAPIMPNRFRRQYEVAKKIYTFMSDGIDIISLQEVNSHRIGVFGWLFYRLRLYKLFCVWMQQFIEFLLIMEGMVMPLFVYDNTIINK